MKRILMTILGSAIAMAFAAAAVGQTTDQSGANKNAPATDQTTPATPPASTTAPNAGSSTATPAPDASATQTPAAQASGTGSASAAASAEAGKNATQSNPMMDRVKERGMKASAKARAEVDKQLDEMDKQVDNEAATKGDAEVAGRLAVEFGVTPDALMAEHSQYGRGWGELVIAHTLQANTKNGPTVADLFQMRSQGMGWGAIAAGLGLKLGGVVPAVKSEGRVAMGLEKGDGKAATIASATMATKAKAGGVAKAGAKVSGGAKAGTGASGAGVGVGAGVDLKGATGK